MSGLEEEDSRAPVGLEAEGCLVVGREAEGWVGGREAGLVVTVGSWGSAVPTRDAPGKIKR